MTSNWHRWLYCSCFLGSLIASISCTSHPSKSPPLAAQKTSDSSAVDFILPEYEILDTLKGDLNGDAYADMLLLMRHQHESQSNENLERPLFILLGSATGYRLGAMSRTAVYCHLCGGVMGDPYTGMQIDSTGTFTISHYGGSNWRWTRNLTFRFDKESKDWLLFQDVSESFSVFDEQDIQVDTRTTKDFGQLSISSFNINEE